MFRNKIANKVILKKSKVEKVDKSVCSDMNLKNTLTKNECPSKYNKTSFSGWNREDMIKYIKNNDSESDFTELLY